MQSKSLTPSACLTTVYQCQVV
uniref:Uncharacterized protein n=1 Tax=Rhizophora mucronata TaxID=61149 RepID=A0A2P2QGD3_RHIMU